MSDIGMLPGSAQMLSVPSAFSSTTFLAAWRAAVFSADVSSSKSFCSSGEARASTSEAASPIPTQRPKRRELLARITSKCPLLLVRSVRDHHRSPSHVKPAENGEGHPALPKRKNRVPP